MSTPPYTPPGGGYVTPSGQYGQQKSGPGCWVWGLGTCLVIVLLVVVVVATSLYKLSKSSVGKRLFSSMHTAIGEAEQLPEAKKKMEAVRAAIVRYDERNGTYPPNLHALVPDYIDSATELHTNLDPDPDPTHVSFTYKAPKPGQPQSTPLLSFHFDYTLDIMSQKQTVDTEVDMYLDGSSNQIQTQSMSMPTRGASPGTPPESAPMSLKTITHTSPSGKVTISTSGPPAPGMPASP